MISIYEASLSDIPAIRDIAHRTWPNTFGHILSEAQIAYMLELMYSDLSLSEQILLKKHQFLLAKSETQYVGYTSVESHYLPSVSKLHKIYVLPNCQGLNIGRQLLQEVERKTKEAGDSYLRLNVNRDNNAVGFYKKNGFEVIAEEDIDIGNGYFMNDYVMQKMLTF